MVYIQCTNMIVRSRLIFIAIELENVMIDFFKFCGFYKSHFVYISHAYMYYLLQFGLLYKNKVLLTTSSSKEALTLHNRWA